MKPPDQPARGRFGALRSETTLTRLYWSLRISIGFIWLWTAWVSWYAYPHADAIALLRRAGMTSYTELVFAAACLMDLGMGIASCLFATSLLWWSQFALVAVYTVVISICLPEFLMHPFGPIIKNAAVLMSLTILALADRR